MSGYRRYYAGIDIGAIESNVEAVREKIPDNVKIMAVVKADAYGHGACTVAEYLEDRVDWFGVADIDEAIELRRSGIKKPVLILGFVDPEDYKASVENDIALAMFSLKDAEKLSAVAMELNKKASVHIKLDTGMSRIGYQPTPESADQVEQINNLPYIKVEGLFSHFATADEKDLTEALLQRTRYDTFVRMLETRGVHIGLKHLDNSAGTMAMDKYYDMVRIGIIMYGLYPSSEIDKCIKLIPAMELISHISMVKQISPGTGVSYGRTYVADKTVKVATVPVGYADGYPRSLSNKGEVLINGRRCRVIGRVCMDQMMVDVTGVECQEGDRVVLVGRSGDEYISVEEVAEAADTFNYEFICRVGRRVPRRYFKNGKCIKEITYLG